ncbi:MAG: hypothetical protein IKE81_10450, partial [Clostridia bacterium]|nr:hypothetical protein [Clostridia bacterium]
FFFSKEQKTLNKPDLPRGNFFQNQLKKSFRSERIGHTGLKKFFARAGKTGLPGTQPVKGENFFRKLLKK